MDSLRGSSVKIGYVRVYIHIYIYIHTYTYMYMYRRRKVFCIEFSVRCCTLRPKTQDEGPVYGAYKTTPATVGGNYSA